MSHDFDLKLTYCEIQWNVLEFGYDWSSKVFVPFLMMALTEQKDGYQNTLVNRIMFHLHKLIDQI